MKILVLGGNGFIGSHIVDELLSNGHKVRVMGRSPDTLRKPLADVEYIVGDFSDTVLVAEALQNIDSVIHLISSTVPSTSNLDPLADIDNNLVNSVRLFQLMVSANIKRIIYFSSGGTIYGSPNTLPIPETHELNPKCSYGIVKLSIEKYLFMFKELYGLQPLIFRPSNPYGPRQPYRGLQGVISAFMYKILTSEKIVIWGDGSVKRDYNYITDLSHICRLGVESNIEGIFNVGSGISYSLNEIVEFIETVTATKATIEYEKSRAFDVNEIKLDITKVQEQFNWQPTIKIEDGIYNQYMWMKEILARH